MLVGFQLVTRIELAVAGVRESIGSSVDRLHMCLNTCGNLPICPVNEQQADRKGEASGERPSERLWPPGNCTCRLRSGPIQNNRLRFAARLVKTDQALAEMSFHQKCLRLGKGLRSIGGEHLLHIITTVDGVYRDALDTLNSEALRYPPCRRSQHRGVGLIVL